MLVRANELKEVKIVFIFNIYILKLKIIGLFQPLNTLSNSDPNLQAFIINDDEWEHLSEIEQMLKVSYNLKN